MPKSLTVFALALASSFATAALSATPHYAVAGRIAAPDGGWDYASVDPANGRLYVARSENVTEIDLAKPAAVRSIGIIARGHAAIPIADRGLLLVTSGRDDSVRLINAKDGHETARIAVGSDPDAAIYDAVTHRAAVMNAKAGTVSVIDIASAAVVRTINLKPGLEYGVMGPAGVLYVNNEEANEIESVDLATGIVHAAIAMPGCEGPSGLGYDSRTGVLVSACSNGKAAVVDIRARRMVGLIDIGRGPDAVLLDTERRVALIPCGRTGVLEVLALDAPGGVARVATIPTAVGARTGAIDPRDGTVYLPTADFAPAAAAGARPTAVSGSFHILVLRR